jgi:hypothetical protein
MTEEKNTTTLSRCIENRYKRGEIKLRPILLCFTPFWDGRAVDIFQGNRLKSADTVYRIFVKNQKLPMARGVPVTGKRLNTKVLPKM